MSVATTLQRKTPRLDERQEPVRTGVLVRWHQLRRDIAIASSVVAFVCAAAFAWPAMVLAGIVTLGLVADAIIALANGRSRFAPTLLLDITASGFVLALVGVPPIAIATATSYFVVLVAVLGTSARTWPLAAYAIVVGLLASAAPWILDTPTPPRERVIAAGIAVVGVFSVAIMIVITRFASLTRGRLGEEEQRARVSEAVSRASRALVAQDDPRALAVAADAIRAAIGVDTVFVERNVIEDRSELVAVVVETSTGMATINEVFSPGGRTHWSGFDGARAHLEGGAPFFFRIEESAGTNHDRTGEGGAHSEVNVPIVLGGKWVGVIGAADGEIGRRWSSDDLGLLRTFADLTSAFWQRVEDLRVRDSLIGSLDGRLRYEEALAASSKSLLGGTGVGVDSALDAAGVAAKVDEVFVTRTFRLDDGSPASEIIANWVQPGLVPTRPTGQVTAYSDMPEVLGAVHKGSLARTTTGPYDEMAVGIEVGDGWFGTVGFLRKHSTRAWSKRDAAFLRTIADILGAYYERAQNRRHLEALILSKDQLIASVSHELRTPLTAVVGLAEELGSDDGFIDEEERRQLISVIAQESREMADLVDDLLIAARSEDGQVLVFPERTDLSLLAGNVAGRLSVPSGVSVSVDDTPSAVFADPVRIRQIIRNLLTNAIRYGGTTVKVSFGSGEGSSYVDVFDDGPGIPDHDLEAIFEPYGRATASSVVPGSVGLGLTLSKRLAELMGGSLSYVPSQGCTFRLSLPATDNAAEDPA